MKYTLCTALAFLIISCGVKINIESNKAPDFSEKITKLYILIKETDNAKAFMYPFFKGFEAHLAEKNIPFQEYFQDALSLETDEDVDKKIQEYGPNLIMVISQSQSIITHSSSYNSGFNNGGFKSGGFKSGGFGYNSYGGGTTGRKITGGIFDIKLYKPGVKNPVWRGSLKVNGASGIKKAGMKAYDVFIQKLIEDQLLDG